MPVGSRSCTDGTRTRLPGPIVVALVVLLAAPGSGCRESKPPAAEFTSVNGSVNVNSKPAVAGQPLAQGDLIELSPGGTCQLVFTDGARAELLGEEGQGTSLKLARPVPGAVATTLELARGAVGLFVPKLATGQTRYEVETANCTTSIEGTVFLVAVLTGKTRVLVADGRVKVSNPLGSAIVETGREAVAGDGEAPALAPEPFDVRLGLGKAVEDFLEDSKRIRSIRTRDFRPREGR